MTTLYDHVPYIVPQAVFRNYAAMDDAAISWDYIASLADTLSRKGYELKAFADDILDYRFPVQLAFLRFFSLDPPVHNPGILFLRHRLDGYIELYCPGYDSACFMFFETQSPVSKRQSYRIYFIQYDGRTHSLQLLIKGRSQEPLAFANPSAAAMAALHEPQASTQGKLSFLDDALTKLTRTRAGYDEVIFGSSAVYANLLPTIIARDLAKALVRIECNNSYTTGFFISYAGHIFTVAHGIEEDHTLNVYWCDADNNVHHEKIQPPLTLMKINHVSDAAIIRIDVAPAAVMPFTSHVSSGPVTAWALGFGNSNFRHGQRWDDLNIEGAYTANVKKVGPHTLFEFPATVRPGICGGPLINQEGRAFAFGAVTYGDSTLPGEERTKPKHSYNLSYYRALDDGFHSLNVEVLRESEVSERKVMASILLRYMETAQIASEVTKATRTETSNIDVEKSLESLDRYARSFEESVGDRDLRISALTLEVQGLRESAARAAMRVRTAEEAEQQSRQAAVTADHIMWFSIFVAFVASSPWIALGIHRLWLLLKF